MGYDFSFMGVINLLNKFHLINIWTEREAKGERVAVIQLQESKLAKSGTGDLEGMGQQLFRQQLQTNNAPY